MAAYKTPDVYIEEIPLLPPSIAQVDTAIPVFIGHTRFANDNGKDLTNVAVKINSLAEYHQYFGDHAPVALESVNVDADGKVTVHRKTRYFLYNSVYSYFRNNGGSCYIISVGNFEHSKASGAVSKDKLIAGLGVAEKHEDITILVFSDALNLEEGGLYSVQQAALAQCEKTKNRFVIMDMHERDGWESGYKEFRNKVGINSLKYGAAYTPHLITDLERRPITLSHFMDCLKVDGKDAETLAVLSDNPTVIELINSLMMATKNVMRISSSSYKNLPQTSPLVNDIPNVEIKEIESTDIEQFIKAQKAGYTNLQAGYNTLLQPIKDAIQNDKKKDVTKEVTDLLSLWMKLIPVIWNWTNEQEFTKEIAQSVKDQMDAFVTFVTAEGDKVGARLSAELKGLKDSLKDIDAGDLFAPMFAVEPPKGDDGKPVEVTKFDKLTAVESFSHRMQSHLNAIQSSSYVIKRNLEDSLGQIFPTYANIVEEIAKASKTVPPSGAIAGIYASTDRSRGVWKAPANVSLSSVTALTHNIDNRTQEGLNVDVIGGKSINAIRAFPGKGLLVWGARTLAGNDNEWRYIPVRRLFNMVEVSVKNSTYWAVFEPNDANLWVKVKGMIDNYLLELWKQGALAGATPDQAFKVEVGLGKTMTPNDINEGRLIVDISMAPVKPAEFIVLRFMHMLQQS